MMQTTGDLTNLETFEALFLSLGPDVVKLDGSRHDAELMTAKAAAAGRWLKLQQLEAQVEREEAILAARPKERGYAPGDEFIADSLVERQAAAWKVQTDEMASSLEFIREEAKKERKLLLSFVVRNGIRREEGRREEMAGKTPVKQADNLPNTPKPEITRPTPKTVPIKWDHPTPKSK